MAQILEENDRGFSASMIAPITIFGGYLKFH